MDRIEGEDLEVVRDSARLISGFVGGIKADVNRVSMPLHVAEKFLDGMNAIKTAAEKIKKVTKGGAY